MKRKMLAILTALCCGASVMAMPVQAASHTFESTPSDEWYAAQTEVFQDQWVLGEDGVIYLDEDEIEFPFDPYIPNPGTFDRSNLLLSLLHDYPSGKFAVRFDVSFADASTETRVSEMRKAVPFLEGADGERYAILTADKLNNFPTYEEAGYRIHLAKASDCEPDEQTLPIRYFAVVGYDEAKEDFVIMSLENSNTYYLPDEYAAKFMEEGSPAITYGDILLCKGQMIHTELAGTNTICFIDPQAYMSEEYPAVGSIEIVDSVFVNGVEALYEVTNLHPPYVALEREDKKFLYSTDFTAAYPQPNGVDWSAAAIGDEIDFVTYAGRLVLPVKRKAPQTSGGFDVIESIVYANDGSGRMAYLTNKGFFLESVKIAPYLTEGSAMPQLGDVISYSYISADFSSPARMHFGENSYVTNLGPAWDYYDGRIELTVTSYQMDELDCEQSYDLVDAETGKTYSKGYTNGYEHGFGTEPMQVGDVVTYVTDEKGNLLYPLSVERADDTQEETLPVRDFIVIGVDNEENPQNYIVYHPATVNAQICYLTAAQVETFLNEGEPQPAYGDILEISGDLLYTALAGTNMMTFIDEKAEPVTENDGKHGIDVTGNVLANEERETYCIQVSETMKNGFSLPYETDPETGATKSYAYYHDAFIDHGYVQPDGIDLENIGTGDEMTFLMYNGFPVIPTAISRLGDANADGALTIVDVVMVNRHIMGADMARTTMNTDAADFDKNGEVTHEDSLSILKRLVGLV